jgi:hypothetical protein
MANTILKIGNMASTNVDAYLKAAQYSAAIQNGSHVVLGALVSGEDQLFVAATPAAVTTDLIYIVDAPVIVETGTNRLRVGEVDPRNFDVAADTPFRVRLPKVGDTLTLSVDGFSSAPTVGEYAVPANGSLKLAPSSTISTATLVYKVDQSTYISVGSEFVTAYDLTVVKAP